MQPQIDERRIVVTRTVPHTLPPVDGDPQRLQQVLANVLSNAVKFTPEGGWIEIGAASTGAMLEIVVRDSGIGIAPEFLPYVFDRFRQGDSRSTRRHGGLGLGLAIARHLLEQHGGEIEASSEGVSLGTTIRIRLPAGAALPAGVIPAPIGLRPDPMPELRMDGATVVVVDDQRDSREWLATLFEQRGARVVRCESAALALEAIQSSLVHLLVADIAMPDVDGYELVRRVRQVARRVPAIAVSAYARSQDRERALASGYDGYCAKPLDAGALLQTVRAVLRTAS
jgi:CheY-like chemotaxis protein